MKKLIISYVILGLACSAVGQSIQTVVSFAAHPDISVVEQAMICVFTSCPGDVLPSIFSQLAVVQDRFKLSDAAMREAILGLLAKALPEAQEWDKAQIVMGTLQALERYGTENDIETIWEAIFLHGGGIRGYGYRTYLRLTDYNPDGLPRRFMADKETFDDLDRAEMMRTLCFFYDSLARDRQDNICQFFFKAAQTCDDLSCANVIDGFLRERVAEYMESDERREMVRRFGHMKGWRGGTDTGEVERGEER